MAEAGCAVQLPAAPYGESVGSLIYIRPQPFKLGCDGAYPVALLEAQPPAVFDHGAAFCRQSRQRYGGGKIRSVGYVYVYTAKPAGGYRDAAAAHIHPCPHAVQYAEHCPVSLYGTGVQARHGYGTVYRARR